MIRSEKLHLSDLRVLLRDDGVYTHSQKVTIEDFVEVGESLGGVEVETKAGRYLLVPIREQQ